MDENIPSKEVFDFQSLTEENVKNSVEICCVNLSNEKPTLDYLEAMSKGEKEPVKRISKNNVF